TRCYRDWSSDVCSSDLLHTVRQILDGDFFGVAHVYNFTDGAPGVHEADETLGGVAHIAETTGLFAAAINSDGGVFQSGLDEVGEHHSITSGLTGTHGVKQAGDDDGKLFFLPIREREKFVERLGSRVTPTALGGRTQ